MNGIDLSDHRVGEILDCSDRAARLLVLEGWGEIASDEIPSENAIGNCDEEPVEWHSTVKVRIVRQPTGRIDGISLKHYHPGQTYEVPPALANYLVIEGYAIVEMRRVHRASPTGSRIMPITLHRSSRRS